MKQNIKKKQKDGWKRKESHNKWMSHIVGYWDTFLALCSLVQNKSCGWYFLHPILLLLLLLCYGTRYTDQIVKVGTQQSANCRIGMIIFLCSDVEFCCFSVNFSFAARSFLSNKNCHIVVLNLILR